MIDLSIFKEVNRRPSPRELMKLGLLFLIVLPLLAYVQHHFYHRDRLALGLAIAGGSVFVLSWIPPIGRLLYVGWMFLGAAIGLVTQPIIMGTVYYLLFTPVSIVFWLLKRDSMKRSLERDRASYWEPYPETKSKNQYFEQF